MVRAKSKYCLGGMEFSTKTAVHEHARKLLYAGHVETLVKPQDVPFLLDLVRLHPMAATKLYKGCVGFVRRRFACEPAPHFEIIHEDNTTTSFSITECISPKSRVQKVLSAFRYEVSDYHRNKKFELFKKSPRCAITGQRLEFSDAHLDHYPVTFQKIVTDFLAERGMTIEDVRLTKLERGIPKDVIDSVKMADEFYEYHSRTAKYRLLHKSEHMKLTRCE